MAIAQTPTSLVRKKMKLIGLLRDCAKHLETEDKTASTKKATTAREDFDHVAYVASAASPNIVLLYQTLGALHEHTGREIAELQNRMKRSVEEYQTIQQQQQHSFGPLHHQNLSRQQPLSPLSEDSGDIQSEAATGEAIATVISSATLTIPSNSTLFDDKISSVDKAMTQQDHQIQNQPNSPGRPKIAIKKKEDAKISPRENNIDMGLTENSSTEVNVGNHTDSTSSPNLSTSTTTQTGPPSSPVQDMDQRQPRRQQQQQQQQQPQAKYGTVHKKTSPQRQQPQQQQQQQQRQQPQKKKQNQVKLDLLKTLGQLRADIQEAADTINNDNDKDSGVEEKKDEAKDELDALLLDPPDNDYADDFGASTTSKQSPSRVVEMSPSRVTTTTSAAGGGGGGGGKNELDPKHASLQHEKSDDNKTDELEPISEDKSHQDNAKKSEDHGITKSSSNDTGDNTSSGRGSRHKNNMLMANQQLYELSSLLDEEVTPAPPVDDFCERGAIEVLLEVDDDATTVASLQSNSPRKVTSQMSTSPASNTAATASSSSFGTNPNRDGNDGVTNNRSIPSTSKGDDDAGELGERRDQVQHANADDNDNATPGRSHLTTTRPSSAIYEQTLHAMAIAHKRNQESGGDDEGEDSYLDWMLSGKQCSS